LFGASALSCAGSIERAGLPHAFQQGDLFGDVAAGEREPD